MSRKRKYSKSASGSGSGKSSSLITKRLQLELDGISRALIRLTSVTDDTEPELTGASLSADDLNRAGNDVSNDVKAISGAVNWKDFHADDIVRLFNVAERRQALRRDLQVITASRSQLIDSALSIAYRRGERLKPLIDGLKEG